MTARMPVPRRRMSAAPPLLWLLVALAIVAAGCATVTCQPTSITVADKEERRRFEQQPRGLRTTEFGRVEEIYREVFVSEYWLRDETGTWHRVAENVWGPADLGDRIEVCR